MTLPWLETTFRIPGFGAPWRRHFGTATALEKDRAVAKLHAIGSHQTVAIEFSRRQRGLGPDCDR
jgi:hypothetical protein